MQNQYPFVNFGKVLQTIAILDILNAIYIVFSLLFLDILPRFGVIMFDFNDLPIIETFISLALGLINLILLTILLITANRIKELVQHIHFSQFYSYILIGFLLVIFSLIYSIVVPFIAPLFVMSENIDEIIRIMYIFSLGGTIIAFIYSIIIMVAWANFLRFTKMKQFPTKVINSSFMIKIGYTIIVIENIFNFFYVVFSILLDLSFPFGYYLALVIVYMFLITDVLFAIIIPIFMIMGKFQLSSAIQLVSYNTSEPKLGDYHDSQSSQDSVGKSRTCQNCGSFVPDRAEFCPNCGNSA